MGIANGSHHSGARPWPCNSKDTVPHRFTIDSVDKRDYPPFQGTDSYLLCRPKRTAQQSRKSLKAGIAGSVERTLNRRVRRGAHGGGLWLALPGRMDQRLNQGAGYQLAEPPTRRLTLASTGPRSQWRSRRSPPGGAAAWCCDWWRCRAPRGKRGAVPTTVVLRS